MTSKDDIESAMKEIEAIKAELNCRADFGIYFKLRRAEMKLERLLGAKKTDAPRKID